MIDEIKRRIENNRDVDLECISKQSFIDKTPNTKNNTKLIEQESLTVSHVDKYGKVYLEGKIPGVLNYISPDELKFFKNKEQENIPSFDFDDLVTIALQAVKDGVAVIEKLDKDSIYVICTENNEEQDTAYRYSETKVKECIDFVNSLYTEKFVIESLSDVERIKLNAKFYQNGFEYIIDESKLNSLQDYKLFVLKGATVIQEKEIKNDY